jgi:hypothetical protein
LYGQECFGFLSYKDVALWTKQHTLPDVRIAALDVGMIAYYSDRYIFDLWGLVTNEMTESTVYFADDMGSKYEYIEHMPIGQRPDYFFVHQTRFDERGDEAHLNPLRMQKIYTAHIPGGDVYPQIGTNLSLYKLDWNVSKNPTTLYNPQIQEVASQLNVIEELDVADLGSHRHYKYQFTPSVPGLFQANRLLQASYPTGEMIWDGAWGIDGREQFVLSLQKRLSVYMIMRTIFIKPPGIIVQVNGKTITMLMTPTDGNHWAEKGIWIPAEHLKTGENDITLVGQYMSAHYWFYQADE